MATSTLVIQTRCPACNSVQIESKVYFPSSAINANQTRKKKHWILPSMKMFWKRCIDGFGTLECRSCGTLGNLALGDRDALLSYLILTFTDADLQSALIELNFEINWTTSMYYYTGSGEEFVEIVL